MSITDISQLFIKKFKVLHNQPRLLAEPPPLLLTSIPTSHVTHGGQVTLCILIHVPNPAILVTFWRQIMDSLHKQIMANESL